MSDAAVATRPTTFAEIEAAVRAHVAQTRPALPPVPAGETSEARWAREAHHWRGQYEHALTLLWIAERGQKQQTP